VRPSKVIRLSLRYGRREALVVVHLAELLPGAFTADTDAV
jgi:hypothetical protein